MTRNVNSICKYNHHKALQDLQSCSCVQDTHVGYYIVHKLNCSFVDLGNIRGLYSGKDNEKASRVILLLKGNRDTNHFAP